MSAAMTEFDFIKLVILIWFLAPFGYNASDMIFDLVSISNVREERMSSWTIFQVVTPLTHCLTATLAQVAGSAWFRFLFCLGVLLRFGEYFDITEL